MSKTRIQLKHQRTFAGQRIHPRSHRSLSTFRLSILGLLLTFNFTLLISSCGLDIEDPTPPSPPVWVQKSLPEEWPERGIDAHESGGIFFEWTPNPVHENIAKYHIYRAEYFSLNDSLGEYTLITRLETEFIARTEYLDEVVGSYVRYSYKLKAEGASGNLSEYSDSLTYMRIPEVNISNMNPNGLSTAVGSEIQLSWSLAYNIEFEDYCISLLTNDNQFLYRDNFQPTNYLGWLEHWDIPVDVELVPGTVYNWRVDTGANYIDDRETAGSESSWASFKYVGG